MLIFFFTSCSSSLLSLPTLGLEDSEINRDLEVLDSEIIRDLGIGVLLGEDSDISRDRESGDNAVETDFD